MLTQLSRKTFKSFRYAMRNLLHSQNIQTSSINKSIFSIPKYDFATKKKRVIQLDSSKINFQSLSIDVQTQKQEAQTAYKSYLQVRQRIESLPWEEMPFHQLCSLDQQLIDALQTELKKDKFNISDEEFIANQLKSGQQIPLGSYDQLDRHYKKVYTLLKGTNHFYDEFSISEEVKKGYLHEMYLTDLKNDKELNQVLARFVKHVSRPQKLEAIAEPTFVKYLLSLKRQLLMQGIHFQTKAEKKEAKHKKENIIESKQTQQLPKIKILQILNYEYEFWQDVKHNRAKNGNQDDFQIETRQIQNPNQSILLRELYPTVKIKYIARNKSLKRGEKCFCLKADLLVDIDQKMKRKVKIEWKGPSSTSKNQIKARPKKSPSEGQPDMEEEAPKVGYIVIDYQNIYDGNPTIRPIFHF